MALVNACGADWCVVCLESIADVILMCNHRIYCSQCLEVTLQRALAIGRQARCAMCRQPLEAHRHLVQGPRKSSRCPLAENFQARQRYINMNFLIRLAGFLLIFSLFCTVPGTNSGSKGSRKRLSGKSLCVFFARWKCPPSVEVGVQDASLKATCFSRALLPFLWACSQLNARFHSSWSEMKHDPCTHLKYVPPSSKLACQPGNHACFPSKMRQLGRFGSVEIRRGF